MKENSKFKDIPISEGTKILFSLCAFLGEYEVTYQKWVWDGIYAESFIFYNKDIISLSEDEIILEVKESPMVKADSKITYRKGDAYTFVNFNFVTE